MTDADAIVLGGGVAGLAVAHYARRRGATAQLFEASSSLGGNARTLECRGFRYDTGAHRFHDRFPAVTTEVRRLLGRELHEVHAPSQIVSGGRRIDFPLTPINIARHLGWRSTVAAGAGLVWSRLTESAGTDFESVARRAYGDVLSARFLLNYSQKLWGVPCRQLSPAVAGRRLSGLSIRTLAAELMGGTHGSRHLEGSFLYPSRGIGAIADALAMSAGVSNVHRDARVTRISHDGSIVREVEINGRTVINSAHSVVVSTLPMTRMLELLDPPPPDDLRRAAASLRFRHVRLVALLLDIPRVTPNASLYFPSADVLFTRVTEPRNRSAAMAPPRQTSLSVEVPYFDGDEVAHLDDEDLARRCEAQLVQNGVVPRGAVFGAACHRLRFAYPVLELIAVEHVRSIEAYLGGFLNLRIPGRAARFSYTHIHDLLQEGSGIAAAIVEARSESEKWEHDDGGPPDADGMASPRPVLY